MLRRIALSACALVMMGAAPAAATTPGAELELAVTATNGYTYSTDLTCMPTDGDHTHANRACTSLKDAHGKFSQLRVQDWRVCTKEYAPVTLSAVGHWKGRPVMWAKTFPNECEAHRQTDQVFDF